MEETFGVPEENKKNTNSKLVILSAVVVVIALAALGWNYRDSFIKPVNPQKSEPIMEEETANMIGQVAIEDENMFAAVIKDFPWEENVKVIQYSYNASAATSSLMTLTRKYISNKNLDDNIILYNNYFNAKGSKWKVTSGINDNLHKRLEVVQVPERQAKAVVDFVQNAKRETVATITYTFVVGHAPVQNQPAR